jgi:predicted alpha/beta superfamily hydrolase
MRLVLAGLLLGVLAGAQAALLAPKSDAVESTVLHERRAIEVYLPEEAQKDLAQRFETLYVLDGDWNAKLVVDVVQFMRQLGLMPPIILVSVPNHFDAQGANSRDRDFTPSPVADQPGSGGAANFLRFLKTELLPYVDQHYPTNPAGSRAAVRARAERKGVGLWYSPDEALRWKG